MQTYVNTDINIVKPVRRFRINEISDRKCY